MPSPTAARLSREELQGLLVINPWASVRAIALDWACIAVAIGSAVWALHPLVVLAAMVVVGSRQHALMTLIHEASHKGLFKDARVRAWAGALLAWPMGLTVDGYRTTHRAHHRYLNTAEDPDWTRNKTGAGAHEFQYPQPHGKLAWGFFQHATGLRTADTLRSLRLANNAPPPSTQPRRGPPPWLQAPLTISVVVALAAAGWLWVALLLWLLPLLTVTKGILMFRTVAEHFGIERDGVFGLDDTRTVIPGALGRLLLAPHNIYFHREHHEYPGVRFDKLPEAHRLLREKGWYDGHKVYRGYGEVWRELTGTLPAFRKARAPSPGTPRADENL